MFPIERRQKIIAIIEKENSISVSELSKALKVSVVTVRKDLDVLENEGLVTRTYGGVVLPSNAPPAKETSEKNTLMPSLIVEAAKFISPGQTIMLGGGKQIVQLAEYIQNIENLTVITISVEVALQLLKSPHLDVILTGGILRARTLTMLGHLAERVIKEIFFDLSFTEVDGIHPTYGLTSTNIVEASTEATLLKASNRPIILSQAAAIGKIAPAPVSKLKPNMTILTDEEINPGFTQQFEKCGINLIVAKGSKRGGDINVD